MTREEKENSIRKRALRKKGEKDKREYYIELNSQR